MPLTFATPRKRREHFGKHGAEFGATSDTAYEAMAAVFLTAPITMQTWQAKRPRFNDIIRYNHITNEFAVLSASGYILTYFKPDVAEHTLPRNLDYYLVNAVQMI